LGEWNVQGEILRFAQNDTQEAFFSNPLDAGSTKFDNQDNL